MAKVKKPLEENGIHRAKTWEIGFYALNNTSTNLWMMAVAYISYFLIGIVGVGSVLAGSLVTVMRIWDGVTDPFVGMIVDKTDTKFGKNRPFIVIGNIILFACTWIMFHIIPMLPAGTAVRLPAYIIIYMIYIIGYTCQCVVTKSAQTCLTNDPEQRPVFAMFDTVYNLIALSLAIPMYVTSLAEKHTLTVGVDDAKIEALVAQNPNLANVMSTGADGVTRLSGFYNLDLFYEMQYTLGAISAVFAVLAIIGLSRKDNKKYFGTGQAVKVGIKDYADTLCHNRAIQMLIVSAASDKLSMTMGTNATVMMVLYGVVFGNYAYYSAMSQISAIPCMILTLWAFNKFARKLGQKAAMMFGTYAGLIGAAVLFVFFLVFNPKGDASVIVMPTAFKMTNPLTWVELVKPANWSFAGLLFIVIYCVWKAFYGCANSIVITMTADCADYEVYRTGKYVPGLMGTLFSFVDKLISSFGSTLVAVMFSLVGFKDALPTQYEAYTDGLFWIVIACFLGAPVIGWLCNVVAMKFYPLTKEKMEEIQDKIAEIKAQAEAAQA